MSRYCLFAILLFLNISNIFGKNLSLLILHDNDIHGRFDETSVTSEKCEKVDREHHRCVGGFPRMAHVIRKARKDAIEGKGAPILYLNAGDTYTGTTWFNLHKWKITAEFCNLLHPDAMSFGNHEFDDGIPGLVPFINAVTFPIIAANLNFTKEPQVNIRKVTKSVILEIEGRRIGIIGYVTPTTEFTSGETKVIWSGEVESIITESERLHANGVKIIIALGHSGFNIDKIIAREVPLVDAVIGGHTNTFLWNGQPPSIEKPVAEYPYVVTQNSGKRVPVVQAYAFTKYLGRLHLTFDENGEVIAFNGQPVFLDNTIPQDQDVLDLLDKYRPEVDALEEVVGTSKVLLDGSCRGCRGKECNLGNLIADAFVASYVSIHKDSDAPIGLVNAGLMRDSIKPYPGAGSITKGQIVTALPYTDYVIAMSLTGADLLQSLQIGAAYNGSTSGGEFLQVSGMHYTVDANKPVGSRVIDAKVRHGQGSPPVYRSIDPGKKYRIVTTGFLNMGGDGHYLIRNGFDKAKETLDVVDTLLWYMKQFPVLDTKEEGRLTTLGRYPSDDCPP